MNCSKCGEDKPLEKFRENYDNRRGKTYRRKSCRDCDNAEMRTWRTDTDYVREYHKANPNKRRNGVLKYRYGITVEQYDDMLKTQEGRCAICKSETPGGKGRFHVDHDHQTGEVRALLCHGCNVGLGGFRDSPDILEQAASYIRSYRQEKTDVAAEE